MKIFRRTVKMIIWGSPLVFLSAFVFVIWTALRDSVEQTSSPVSREQALRHCPIELPPAAQIIQYASLAGGLQDCEQYVRFEAPVSDCYLFANSIYDKWSKHHGQATKPQFEQASHPTSRKSSRLQTNWFDTEQIKKAVVAGTGVGYEPRIWIDEERGILYFHVID
jgi:hypothetical protein